MLLVYFKMSWLKVLHGSTSVLCIVICTYELILIGMKYKRDSFEAVKLTDNYELMAPSITLCPGKNS